MNLTPEVVAKFNRRLVRGASDECWLRSHFPRSGKGYPSIRLGGEWVDVHRLACELAHGAPREGQQVLHACDQPRCLNSRHLRWGSAADNIADAHSRGRASNVSIWERLPARCFNDALEFLANGEHPADVARMLSVGVNAIRSLKRTHPLPPPTDTRLLCRTGSRKRSGPIMFTKDIDYRDAHRIKNLRHAGLTRQEVATLFGISTDRIAAIDLGHAWAHVPGPAPTEYVPPPKPPRHVEHGPLTPGLVWDIKQDIASGMSASAVAQKHQRAHSTVRDIARGGSWGWISIDMPRPDADTASEHTASNRKHNIDRTLVAQARGLLQAGHSTTSIAARLRIPARTVRYLRKGRKRTRKHTTNAKCPDTEGQCA